MAPVNKKPIIFIAIIALLAIAVYFMWGQVSWHNADRQPDAPPVPEDDILTPDEQRAAGKKYQELKAQTKADALKFQQQEDKRRAEGRVVQSVFNLDPIQALKYPKRAADSAIRLIKNPNEFIDALKAVHPSTWFK